MRGTDEQAAEIVYRKVRHDSEYNRVRLIVGAPRYPADNRCARCEIVSRNPLIPYRFGWCCRTCSYPPGTEAAE